MHLLQSPGYVVLAYDGFVVARIIPLGGRPKLDSRIREWMGDARGRWEGDTLVVETTNVNDKQDGGSIPPSHEEYLPGSLHQHLYYGSGATAHIVERFTRVSPTRIEYQYTLDDPGVYVRPYTILRPLEKDDEFLMLENACHEGNYALKDLLSGARADENGALAAAKAEMETRRQQIQQIKKANAGRVEPGGSY
jgi:hypothetical protein